MGSISLNGDKLFNLGDSIVPGSIVGPTREFKNLEELPEGLNHPGKIVFDETANSGLGSYYIVDIDGNFQQLSVTGKEIVEKLTALSHIDKLSSAAVKHSGKTVETIIEELLNNTTGNLYFQPSENGTLISGIAYEIYDEDGTKVKSGVTTTLGATENLPRGVYSLKITSGDYQIVSFYIEKDNDNTNNFVTVSNTLGGIDVGFITAEVKCLLTPSAPPTLLDFKINNGDTTSATSTFSLSFTAIGVVSQYMVSANQNFVGVNWANYTNQTISYTHPGNSDGEVTLYLKVKNSKGESSPLYSSITIVKSYSRSDSENTYGTLKECITAIVDDYTDPVTDKCVLTQDVTVTVANTLTDSVPTGSGDLAVVFLQNFNEGSNFALTIDGNNKLTIDCKSFGGLKFYTCDNVIIKNIAFINAANHIDRTTGYETAAIYIDGITGICKNIVITGCSFSGLNMSSGQAKTGRYAITCSKTENLTIKDCTFNRFGAVVLKFKGTKVISLSNISFEASYVQRPVISQPCLIWVLDCEYLYIEDSDINADKMDTAIISGNLRYLECKRTMFRNSGSEVLRSTSTSYSLEECSFEACCFKNNVQDPAYAWINYNLKFDNVVEKLRLVNCTIKLTAPTNYPYAAFVRGASGEIKVIDLYNNIVDFSFPNFTGNNAAAAFIKTVNIPVVNSSNNVYRDVISTNDIINQIYNLGGMSVRSITAANNYGYEIDSFMFNTSQALFSTVDNFAVLNATISAIQANLSKAVVYDFSKKLLSQEATHDYVGAYRQLTANPVDSGEISFFGYDSIRKVTLTSNNAGITLSNNIVVLRTEVVTPGDVYKWTIISTGQSENIVRFGDMVFMQLTSILDEVGNYVEDAIVDITIEDSARDSTYDAILTIKQSLITIGFTISDLFPFVGDVVLLTDTSKDAESISWETTEDGVVFDTIVDQPTVSLEIASAEVLPQKLTAYNTVQVDGVSLTKYIKPLLTPEHPYIKFTISDSNSSSESNFVFHPEETAYVHFDNLYGFVGNFQTDCIIYESNTKVQVAEFLNINSLAPYAISLTALGVGCYDVEIRTVYNSVVSSNLEGRVITISPSLGNLEDAFVVQMKTPWQEYANPQFDYTKGMNGDDAWVMYTIVSDKNNQVYPPGSTIIIRKHPDAEANIFRLRLSGLKGTAENPIKVVFDDPEGQFQFGTASWWGIAIYEGCQHVILDGRGFSNVKYGVKLYYQTGWPGGEPSPATDKGITIGGYSTYIDVHSVEVGNIGFAAFSAKTDPITTSPSTWRDGYGTISGFEKMYTNLYNCKVDGCGGEGMYYGYFNVDVLQTTYDGKTVEYRAHKMQDVKIYRNFFLNCGWDGIQLNNGYGACEICYNTILNPAVYGMQDQNLGISISLSGNVHHNYINGGRGMTLQLIPLDAVNIYCNKFVNPADSIHAIQLLGGWLTPEINNGTEHSNNIPVRIFNNVIEAKGLASVVKCTVNISYNNITFANNIVSFFGSTSNIYSANNSDIVTLTCVRITDTPGDPGAIIELTERDSLIGSFVDKDYRIHPLSIMASNGTPLASIPGLETFVLYGFDGFKNWDNGSTFIGIYPAILRISDSLLTMRSVLINGGDAVTKLRTVTVSYTFSGNATHYIISENPTFAGAQWIENPTGSASFTLSPIEGEHTVYVKLKNSSIPSTEYMSDKINYAESRKFLVNCGIGTGGTYNVPAPPWNRFVYDSTIHGGYPPIGLKVSGLIDQYGTPSLLEAEITQNFGGVRYRSSIPSSFEVNPDYLVNQSPYNPLSAVGSMYEVSNAVVPGEITIHNCDPDKLYDVLLYLIPYSTGVTYPQQFGVQGDVYDYNSIDNRVLVITDVVPNNTNDIVIQAIKSNSSYSAVFALIDLREHSAAPILLGVNINNGATDCYSASVEVDIDMTRVATECRISEVDATLETSPWIPFTNPIPYTFLNQTEGVKTLWVQLKNDTYLSDIVNDTITLSAENSPVLTSISINGGDSSTESANVQVSLNVTGNVTFYKIGEDSQLTGIGWSEYLGGTIPYTFAGETYEEKTVYVQVMNNAGSSIIRSDTIDYIEEVLSQFKVFVDFGETQFQTAMQAGTPNIYWNNLHLSSGTIPSGTELSLVDSDNNALNAKLLTLQDFLYNSSNMTNYPSTVDGYPTNAAKDCIAHPTVATSIWDRDLLKFTGLDDRYTYIVKILSSRPSVSYKGNWKVTGKAYVEMANVISYDSNVATNQPSTEFTDITPINGEIVISAKTTANTRYAYLNVIQLIATPIS